VLGKIGRITEFEHDLINKRVRKESSEELI